MNYKNTIRISSVILFLSIVSCSVSNEFGMRRNKISIEKIKPNEDENAYSIIDTTKIYKLINITIKSDTVVGNNLNGINERNPSYLKFYENGRVGEFRNIDINNSETLNPKRAESHLYSLKKSKFIVQEYFKHPQCGECFIKRILSKNSENQIILTSEDYKYTYEKVEIPTSFLKYKPDW